MNTDRLIITMVEPAGVSIRYERASPIIKQMVETIAEKITTDLKLLHIRIEVKAGKIRRLDISNAPIRRMPITVVIAVKNAISIL